MIAQIFETGLKLDPHKTAIYASEKSYTYQELDGSVGKLATGLQQHLQLKKDDVLAIQSSNTIEFIQTLFACWRIGISVTPMNPALKPDEIKHQLENSKAKCFIYEGYCAEKAREALKDMENPPRQVLLDGEITGSELQFTSIFSDQQVQTSQLDIDTVALIIYTSGTTGKPKGVMLTHHNVSSMLHGIIECLSLKKSDRSYLILPLFHVNSIHFTLSAPLLIGASVVLTNRFSAEVFLRNVAHFNPTYTVAVPTVYKLLADLPKELIQSYDMSSLKFGLCGGAPITTSEFNRFQEKYPFKLLEAYGLSEGTVCSTSNPLNGIQKIGSIGIPFPGQQMKIVDEKGNEVPLHEKGELIIKGENVMLGYLNNPEATRETVKDGWLYTGDLGYEDEDGYFYLVGRKKELIIRGGINIYPKQIEEVIYAIPGVKEVAIVGIYDEKYGEEIIGYVSLEDKVELTESDIIDFCKVKMANYKCPVKITFMKSLPKSSIGKIAKSELLKVAD